MTDPSTLSPVGAVFLLLVVYPLPFWIAWVRAHHQRWAILALTLLLGWSGLGWVAALIWACTATRRPLDA